MLRTFPTYGREPHPPAQQPNETDAQRELFSIPQPFRKLDPATGPAGPQVFRPSSADRRLPRA